MFAIPLALSLAGLTLGPLLVALGRKQTVLFVALEGLTLGLVPALILLRLVPHLYEESGPPAIILMVVGYALFWLVERRGHRSDAYLQCTVVVPAMAVHSLLDGGSLALASATESGAASAVLLGALVLHRLPEGLLLATTLTPEVGFRRMLRVVAVIGAATVIGAFGGRALLESVPPAALHCFVGFGLGVMLRLVVHHHGPSPTRRLDRTVGAMGFLAGIVILPLIGSPEDLLRQAQPRELSMFESLGPLFVETAPALLVGLSGVAVLGALSPRGGHSRLPIAACTCRLLPVSSRLLGSGVAPAATVALLVAASQLDVFGAALSLSLLGGSLTLFRVGAGLLVALTASAIVAAASPRGEVAAPPPSVAPASRGAWSQPAPCDSVRLLLDHIAAWYVLGLLVAAALEALLPAGGLAVVGAPLAVVLGALLALPLRGCPLSAIPPAMILLHKGAPAGAVVSFLVVASASSGVVLAMLRQRLGLRASAIFGAATLALAVGAGLATDAVLPRGGVPDLHDLVARGHGAFAWAAVLITGALLTLSLLRAGPWAWLGTSSGEGECHGGSPAHDVHPGAHASAPR